MSQIELDLEDPVESTGPKSVVADRRSTYGRRRWVILVGLLLAGAAFTRFAWRRITMRPTPRDEYWNAQLNVSLPAPMPGAASLREIDTALATRPVVIQRLSPYSSILRGIPSLVGLDPAELTMMDLEFEAPAWVAQREQLRRLAARPWTPPTCIVSSGIWFAGSGRFEWLTELSLRAVWNLDRKARPREALEDLRLSFSLWARLVRQELLEARAFAISGARQSLGLLIELAGRHPGLVDAKALAADLRDGLGQQDYAHRLADAGGLRMHAAMDWFYVADGGWLDVSTAAEHRAVAMRKFAKVNRIWSLTSPLFDDRAEMNARVVAWQEKVRRVRSVAALAREYSGQLNHIRFFDARSGMEDTRHDGVPSSCIRMFSHYLTELACLNAAILVAAIEQHALAHGRYPDRLDELVPEPFDAIPLDTISGEAFIYQPTDTGYALSTRGSGAQSNPPAGSTRKSAWLSSGYEHGEQVFVIRTKP